MDSRICPKIWLETILSQKFTNTTGLSVYIMGIQVKKYLPETYGKIIGKASVTGYCIKFKTFKDINIDILEVAIRDGVKQSS